MTITYQTIVGGLGIITAHGPVSALDVVTHALT
jgi:hypothetical protein